MVSIPNLTEITVPTTADDLVLETAAGTRRVSRENFQYKHVELSALVPSNINVDNDKIWLSDDTDGFLKAVTVYNLIFGNFTNLQLFDGFALDPLLHNIRPLELGGTFTTANITLSDTTPGIGGASFNFFNFSSSDVTITALNSMTIFENAVITSPVTIRQDTAATLLVNDAGDEAIFAGG
jgi:acetyltransferase-like isoleucine patch superfamily enzyme